MKYNLDVLNDKEFEDFCKDLLDIQFGVDFQIFKAGKDGGIDLLYSNSVENEIVVQIKHYISSTFAQLKQTLVNKELTNIKKLTPRPKKYVVATSLQLSPAQAREIKEILSPFIHSTNDVFGRRRLEMLLCKNNHIEQKFFKLWLTSTNVLKRILHNAAHTNSDFHRDKILSKAQLYVPNKDFNYAVDLLLDNKFLIISGLPGVGKTTFAYMLICERLAAGCELVFSDGKISEVEALLAQDPNKKQVFFIDDFLGANLYDIQNPKNPENKIISFVEKIQHHTNKYLVFTSRTTILKQANHRFESLRRSKITEVSKYELELGNYLPIDRARILYNHLYFKSVSKNFAEPFFKKEVYVEIIKHKNYFPRLIEFITDSKHFDPLEFSTVEKFIFYKLNHPDEIWEHAFLQQLEDEDRFLVMCLFSFGGTTVVDDWLEDAFEARYEYEISNNNIVRKPQAYRNSLKKLLDGFVRASQNAENRSNYYSFLNPSIADYLLSYLHEDKQQQKSLLCSIVYAEQLTSYFGKGDGKIKLGERLRKNVFNHFIKCIDEIALSTKRSKHLVLLGILLEYFPKELADNYEPALKLMRDLLHDASDVDSFDLAIIIVENDIEDRLELNEFVKNNLYAFVDIIVSNAEHTHDLEFLPEIFKQFNSDFKEYIGFGMNKTNIETKLTRIFETLAIDIDFDEGRIIEEAGEMGNDYAQSTVEDKLWDEYVKFVSDAKLDDFFEQFDHSYDVSASEIVGRVMEEIQYHDDRERYEGTITPDYNRPEDPWEEIDRLFLRE